MHARSMAKVLGWVAADGQMYYHPTHAQITDRWAAVPPVGEWRHVFFLLLLVYLVFSAFFYLSLLFMGL
jgi:hypothetical protein